MNSCIPRLQNSGGLPTGSTALGGMEERSMSNNCLFASNKGSRQSHLRPRNLTCYSPTPQAQLPDIISAASERDAAAVDGLLSLMGRKRKREPSKCFYPSMAALPCSPGASSAPMTDTESVKSDEQVAVTLELASPQTKFQQDLSREMQIRYTKEQDDRTKYLEVEVRQLIEGIKKLEQLRRISSTALPASENVWTVVSNYFQLFRHGLRSRAQVSIPTNSRISTQVNFLQTMMRSDAAFNAGRGSDAMIRSWKCISLWFQDVELEVEALLGGVGGALVATTTTSITVTERTLRNVFPHLYCKSQEYEGLAEKLLGQRIVMCGSTRFGWDPELHRVSSVMAESDLFTPMLSLLGNLEDVARVFEKSIISPDFNWRSTS